VNSAQPIRLALSPSGKFAMLILALHAAAALCFLTIMTGWLASAGAALLLFLGLAAAWDRALLRAGGSPSAIEIYPSGEATCRLANGESARLEAQDGSSVTRNWVSVRLRRDGPAQSRRSLLVTAGMLPPESFRLLRLWALWGRLPGVAPRQLPAGS
jgi:hypothetical protein